MDHNILVREDYLRIMEIKLRKRFEVNFSFVVGRVLFNDCAIRNFLGEGPD